VKIMHAVILGDSRFRRNCKAIGKIPIHGGT
jgi:hypothetical protein